MDCIWLFEKIPIEKILKMSTSLEVKGKGSLKYELIEFVSMFLNFFGADLRNHSAYTYIYQELYLVKDLKANLLVGNVILAIERVIINFASKIAIISSCQMTISIIARFKSYLVERKVLVNRSLIISLESKVLVQFVYSGFLDDWKFSINPTSYRYLILFAHILDNSTYKILVPNNLYRPVFLP